MGGPQVQERRAAQLVAKLTGGDCSRAAVKAVADLVPIAADASVAAAVRKAGGVRRLQALLKAQDENVKANATAVLQAMGEPLESSALATLTNVPRADISNLAGARDEARQAREVMLQKQTTAEVRAQKRMAAEAERAEARKVEEFAAAEARKAAELEAAAAKEAQERVAAEAREVEARKAAAREVEERAARDARSAARAAAYSQRVKRARQANEERSREERGVQIAPVEGAPAKRQRRSSHGS